MGFPLDCFVSSSSGNRECFCWLVPSLLFFEESRRVSCLFQTLLSGNLFSCQEEEEGEATDSVEDAQYVFRLVGSGRKKNSSIDNCER